MATKTTRYTIGLDDVFDSTLSELATKKKTTRAEIFRRALATYRYLDAQTPEGSGKKVSITTAKDKVVKDVILP